MSRKLEELLLRASRPTVEMMERMAQRVSTKIRPILLAIGEDFYQPGYGLAELKERGFSKRQLICFPDEVGYPPGRVIRECKRETALRIFLETLLTVEEVALLVGFDSHRTLERGTVAWCGLTPAELRTSLRRVRSDLRKLPGDVFSWYYWLRYSRHELTAEELDPVIAHLETLIGRF